MGLRPFDPSTLLRDIIRLPSPPLRRAQGYDEASRATPAQASQVLQRIFSLVAPCHVAPPRVTFPREATLPCPTRLTWRGRGHGIATGTLLMGDLKRLDSLIVRTYVRDGTLAGLLAPHCDAYRTIYQKFVC